MYQIGKIQIIKKSIRVKKAAQRQIKKLIIFLQKTESETALDNWFK